MVVIGTPDGASKMYWPGLKGSIDFDANLHVDWIYTKNNYITMVFS